MGLTIITKASLPTLTKGKSSGPSVRIGDKGQIALSSAAAAVFDGCKGLAVAYDPDNRKVVLLAGTPALIKQVKGEENLVEIKRPKEGKGKGLFFAASAYFAKTGPLESYNIKDSGNQSFSAVVDDKSKSVSFTLPTGSLPKKPVQKRTKKVKATAPEVPVAGTVSTQNGAEELLLQPA